MPSMIDVAANFFKRDQHMESISDALFINPCDIFNISEDAYRHLNNINSICSDYCTKDKGRYHVMGCDAFKIMGNIFYENFVETRVECKPLEKFFDRQRNFCLSVMSIRKYLEIGFNAGHSALFALLLNPKIQYMGIDNNFNGYTKKCAEYLKTEFKDRFEIKFGDSRELLPSLKLDRSMSDVDLFYVDGGHGEEICRSDIANCISMAPKGSMLLLDDTNITKIKKVYCEFVAKGLLTTETLGGEFKIGNQMLARINFA